MSRTELPHVVLDDTTADPVQNAEVTVALRAGGAATVYQDATGGTTRPQPLLTDAQGRVSGWLDRGDYTLTIAIPSRPTRTEYYDSSPGGDGGIDTNWLAASAVTAGKLASDAVTTIKLLNTAVTTAKLADGAVTTAKITDENVTTGKIANLGVTTAKLANGSVTAAKLDSQLVTSDRVLHRRNIDSFSVGTTTRRSVIFPYPFPSANSSYYRDYYWMFGADTQTDVTLTNVSDKVTVTVWTGGYTTRPGDIDLRVYVDGVPDGYMIESTVDHGGGNIWNAWPFIGGFDAGYNSLYCSQTLDVTPGSHTYNVKLTFSSAYPSNHVRDTNGDGVVDWQDRWGVYYDHYSLYYATDWYWWLDPLNRYTGRFISQGVSLVEVKEEPNV